MRDPGTEDDSDAGDPEQDLAIEDSVGFQIRDAHRLMQRYLQSQIEPHGLSLGMWYFLRALWFEDGLTQSELSRKVGTMEPTTLAAIKAMIASGLVERRRNRHDNRKLNVYLTRKGRALKEVLLPKAMGVNAHATRGISPEELRVLSGVLKKIAENVSGVADA